jgi:hypothetical protein
VLTFIRPYPVKPGDYLRFARQPEAIQNNRDVGAKIIFVYVNLPVPMCLK